MSELKIGDSVKIGNDNNINDVWWTTYSDTKHGNLSVKGCPVIIGFCYDGPLMINHVYVRHIDSDYKLVNLKYKKSDIKKVKSKRWICDIGLSDYDFFDFFNISPSIGIIRLTQLNDYFVRGEYHIKKYHTYKNNDTLFICNMENGETLSVLRDKDNKKNIIIVNPAGVLGLLYPPCIGDIILDTFIFNVT